ncbi:unnamed protein product [Cladocopium goreaui]|uniref:Ubiquitin-like domain-containing protein n=1 Tax=Cladocopium goreaui TaxID=2562237 RepID=A0A9P1FKH9_9DINO|nr:unnamed protein product [Cladocopium goreaui]
MSQRPASARGRLTREPKEASLVHGCSAPPPDAGIGAGPGHFRHFVASVSAKHQLKAPKIHYGKEERILRKQSRGREGGAIRTLDISRVNQERHKWQRIDTFQTPYGNGQASYDGSSQRMGTASRERMGSQTQVLAGLGLEMEQLRLDLKTTLAENKEELCVMIADAVNQIISELRSDVRTEVGGLRQQIHLIEEGRRDWRANSEPVTIQQEIERRSSVSEELQGIQELRSLKESIETLMNDLRNSSASAPSAARAQGEHLQELRANLDAQLQSLLEPMHQVRDQVWSRLERLDQCQAIQMDQVHARLDHLDHTQSSLLEKMDLSTVRQITDLQASSRLLEEAVRAVAEAQREQQLQPRVEATQPVAEVIQQMEEMKRLTVEGFNDLRVNVSGWIHASNIATQEPLRDVSVEQGQIRNALEDIKARQSALTSPDQLKDIREQLQALSSVDVSGQLTLLRDIKLQQGQVISCLDALKSATDLSGVMSALQKLHDDQAALRELQLRHQTEQSSALASLEQVRKGLASVSQEVEMSREMVVKRADVTALSQTMQNAWELMTQTKAAINKVDFSPLHSDVQRVLEELRETRAEVPKTVRNLEVDFTPIMRALQDRKRVDEEFGEKLVEEMHRLRRDCDFTHVTQNLEQVEPALRALRQAVRENRVNCEDLVPLTEEVQRLHSNFSDFRQTRVREFCQLQEELATVKTFVMWEPKEVDLSPLQAIKERQEPLHVEVMQEVKGVKEMLHGQQDGLQDKVRAEELQGVVQDLRLVTTNLVDSIRHEVMKVDLAPLMSEIKDIRSKVEVSSSLKRQNENMTKSDFATALEELRGHFSLLLTSFREVCDHSSGVSASAVNNLLQNLLEQRQRENETTAEDLDFLRRKLRDTQSVIGQVGSRHDELRGRVATGRPPERPVEPQVQAVQAVQEPVTRMEQRPPFEPVTQAPF